jgi:O-antigen/teichoic acid export membrane protein
VIAPSRPGSGVAGIGLAIGVASVAGYALIVVTGRTLDPADADLFLAFWAVLFGIGASLSTIEQEAARQAASGAANPAAPVPAIAAAAAVLASCAAAVTLLPGVALRLYGDADSRLGVVVVLAAAGFAVQFAVRGVLVGSGATRHYAGIIVVEAAVRLLLLLAIALVVGLDVPSAAVAVAAGSFVWLGWVRYARRLLPAAPPHPNVWWSAFRRAGSLMVAAALMASVITGYPAMVSALTEGASRDARGAVFAALMVSRVPLLLVSPIQAVAVPAVVRWRADALTSGSSRLRSVLRGGTLGAVGTAVLGGLVGWAWGPWAVLLVFGPEYVVASAAVAMLVASAFLLAWVLLMSAALIALSAYRRMTLMWLVAVVATLLWLVVSRLDVVTTTAVGALVGPIAAALFGIPVLWSLTALAPRPSAAR